MSSGEEIGFTVLGIEPEPYAAAPILSARIAVTAPIGEPGHAIALRAQIRIEPQRRGYSEEEGAGLEDLFGPRSRWQDTQRSFLWMHCATMIPGFSGGCEADLPLQCTYDLEVAGSKYLQALRGGTVPLLFLFNGTVFVKGDSGFAIHQVPWDRDDRFAMPVSVWRDLMAAHFPNSGWVRLSRETLDALSAYKSRRGLLGYDDAVGELLKERS
ncbi:DUF6084 family protein [Nocardia sp. NPDC051570]|uniref:DUF6084 family protein n=1 Tax=Nocardia sp. NPDC051570 TaxID=3364324 RepID=UPI003788B1F5